MNESYTISMIKKIGMQKNIRKKFHKTIDLLEKKL